MKTPEIVSGDSSRSFVSDMYSFRMMVVEVVSRRILLGVLTDVVVVPNVVKLHDCPNPLQR